MISSAPHTSKYEGLNLLTARAGDKFCSFYNARRVARELHGRRVNPAITLVTSTKSWMMARRLRRFELSSSLYKAKGWYITLSTLLEGACDTPASDR